MEYGGGAEDRTMFSNSITTKHRRRSLGWANRDKVRGRTRYTETLGDTPGERGGGGLVVRSAARRRPTGPPAPRKESGASEETEKGSGELVQQENDCPKSWAGDATGIEVAGKTIKRDENI